MDLFIALLACQAVVLALWLRQRRTRRADWVDVARAALIGLQAG